MERKLIKTHKLTPRRKAGISKPSVTETKGGPTVPSEVKPSPSLPSPEWVEQVLR
jgi:hypothetical protein